MLFDMDQDSLSTYLPERTEQPDFERFWSTTLGEFTEPLQATFTHVETHLKTVDVFDIRFPGYGGETVAGWLLLPRERRNPLPCVVEYCGYSYGRGLHHESLLFSAAGYAHFIMDNRGQGGGGRVGVTADGAADNAAQIGGFLTRGLHDPYSHYYRRLFADAARFVDVARSHPAVDAERVVLRGISQGGGIALAANALCGDPVLGVIANVPFLCHIRRATELVDTQPYAQLKDYLALHRDRVEDAFATLSYFDGVNFAARATSQALFSVALMDSICPPSTVYAAFNHYRGPKEIVAWTYNGHEGGGAFQEQIELDFLAKLTR